MQPAPPAFTANAGLFTTLTRYHYSADTYRRRPTCRPEPPTNACYGLWRDILITWLILQVYQPLFSPFASIVCILATPTHRFLPRHGGTPRTFITAIILDGPTPQFGTCSAILLTICLPPYRLVPRPAPPYSTSSLPLRFTPPPTAFLFATAACTYLSPRHVFADALH